MVLQTGTAGHGVVIARSPELYPFSPYGKHHTCAKAVGFCSYGCFGTNENESVGRFSRFGWTSVEQLYPVAVLLTAYGPEILFNFLLNLFYSARVSSATLQGGSVQYTSPEDTATPSSGRMATRPDCENRCRNSFCLSTGGRKRRSRSRRAAGGSPLRCQAMYWKG